MSLEEVIASALALGLPDLIKLGEAIATEIETRQSPVAAEVAAADVAADAAEDAKFPVKP